MKYVEAELEIIQFTAEDVISTSCTKDCETDGLE